jgi:hypothetical protein
MDLWCLGGVVERHFPKSGAFLCQFELQTTRFKAFAEMMVPKRQRRWCRRGNTELKLFESFGQDQSKFCVPRADANQRGSTLALLGIWLRNSQPRCS